MPDAEAAALAARINTDSAAALAANVPLATVFARSLDSYLEASDVEALAVG